MRQQSEAHKEEFVRLRWKNFRSFVDTGWFEIRPVTILIGANGSGKTSLHVPLLLLKQTLLAQDTGVGLVSRGAIANAGSFSDLVTGHDSRRHLTLGIQWHRHTNRKTDEPLGSHPPGTWQGSFTADPSDPNTIRLEEFILLDSLGRRFIGRKRTQRGTYSLSGLPVSKAPTLGLSPSFLRRIRAAMPEHFLFSQADALAAVVDESRIEDGTERVELSPGILLYASALGRAEDRIADLLRTVSYLGPLRDRPKRSYEISGEVPRDVGVTGEFGAEVLYRSSDPAFRRSVREWVRRFGLAQELQFESSSEGAFSLLLKTSSAGPTVNLADAGFGASQLLPLIIQGLYARERSLMIAEQPEIHLNPRLQVLLADFFVSLANKERRSIIETHSEHLVLRLRRLVAEGHLPSSWVGLYFVEKVGTQSNVREVHIQEDGHVEPDEWPNGFFEETLRESVGLGAAQRIRKSDARRHRS